MLRRLVAAYTQAYISLAKLDNKAAIVAREPKEYSLLLGSNVHPLPQKKQKESLLLRNRGRMDFWGILEVFAILSLSEKWQVTIHCTSLIPSPTFCAYLVQKNITV